VQLRTVVEGRHGTVQGPVPDARAVGRPEVLDREPAIAAHDPRVVAGNARLEPVPDPAPERSPTQQAALQHQVDASPQLDAMVSNVLKDSTDTTGSTEANPKG